MPNWKLYAFVEANYVHNYDEVEAGVAEKSPVRLHIWERIGKYADPARNDKMICGEKAPQTGWVGVGTFEQLKIQSIDDILDYAKKWETSGDAGKWRFCKKCYNIMYRLDEREKKEATPKPKRTLKPPTGRRLATLQKLYDAGAADKWVNWINVLGLKKERQEAGIQLVDGYNQYVQDPKIEKANEDIWFMNEKWLEIQNQTGGDWVRLTPEGILFEQPEEADTSAIDESI